MARYLVLGRRLNKSRDMGMNLPLSKSPEGDFQDASDLVDYNGKPR